MSQHIPSTITILMFTKFSLQKESSSFFLRPSGKFLITGKSTVCHITLFISEAKMHLYIPVSNKIFPWKCMYDRSIIAEWPYILGNFTMAMIVWKKGGAGGVGYTSKITQCMWRLPESVLYANNSAQWWCLVWACSTLTMSSVTIKPCHECQWHRHSAQLWMHGLLFEMY